MSETTFNYAHCGWPIVSSIFFYVWLMIHSDFYFFRKTQYPEEQPRECSLTWFCLSQGLVKGIGK